MTEEIKQPARKRATKKPAEVVTEAYENSAHTDTPKIDLNPIVFNYTYDAYQTQKMFEDGAKAWMKYWAGIMNSLWGK